MSDDHRRRVGAAAKWVALTVLAAAIGVPVTQALSDGGDGQRRRGPKSTPAAKTVSAHRIGPYRLVSGASLADAVEALGEPSRKQRAPGECSVTWEDVGVQMRFGNFSGQDPCVESFFCSAYVSGATFATSKGLRAGDPAERLGRLYPDSPSVQAPGSNLRVLERGETLCGRDAKGGLVASMTSGRVLSLEVSFMAGGD